MCYEEEVIWPNSKFIPIEEVLKLKGIIAVGGDALKDSKRIYDE
jgi:ribosome-associated protein YbcJ (S4-like RNA binding protein)